MTGPLTWLGQSGTPIHSVGEFGLIDRLKSLIERRNRLSGISNEGIRIGIGDDAASLTPTPGRELLVTCDIQVEGRHFIRDWTSPRAFGSRCATISVSDIGAMGGEPKAVVVSLGLGPKVAVEDVCLLYEGMLDRLLGLGCHLIGGNVTSIEQGLLVDLTVIGEVEAGRATRRDAGRAGDIVWATGYPGSSAAGLMLLRAGIDVESDTGLARLAGAYLEPSGRVREGRALGISGAVSSMIDLSDGLIGDLTHLIEGRDLGIVLKEEAIPIRDEFSIAAGRLGCAPSTFPLSASDDYELLFTTGSAAAEEALKAVRNVSMVPVWPIGEMVAGPAGQVVIEDRAGRRRPPSVGGWDHFRSDPQDP